MKEEEEDEEEKMAEVKVVDGVKRVVEKLLGRRKQKRGYEYEVQWKGEAETSWLSRDRLEEMGFQKMLTDIDMKVGGGGGAGGLWRLAGRGVRGGGWHSPHQPVLSRPPVLPACLPHACCLTRRPRPAPRRRRPPPACWASP